MSIVTPATVLCALSALWCMPALSQQAARPSSPAVASAASKPAPPAIRKPPVRRRAVHQVIDGMPAPAAPPAYGPRLDAGPQAGAPAMPNGMTAPVPGAWSAPVAPGPVVLNRCDAGGCTDTGGARYNGASGTLLSPQGRPCVSNGVSVTCL